MDLFTCIITSIPILGSFVQMHIGQKITLKLARIVVKYFRKSRIHYTAIKKGFLNSRP